MRTLFLSGCLLFFVVVFAFFFAFAGDGFWSTRGRESFFVFCARDGALRAEKARERSGTGERQKAIGPMQLDGVVFEAQCRPSISSLLSLLPLPRSSTFASTVPKLSAAPPSPPSPSPAPAPRP